MIETIILCMLAIILAVSVFCSIQAERRREQYLRDIMTAVTKIEQRQRDRVVTQGFCRTDKRDKED